MTSGLFNCYESAADVRSTNEDTWLSRQKLSCIPPGNHVGAAFNVFPSALHPLSELCRELVNSFDEKWQKNLSRRIATPFCDDFVTPSTTREQHFERGAQNKNQKMLAEAGL